jgi:hypothetical protein
MVAGICCRYPNKIAKKLEYEPKKKNNFFLLFLCFVCERFFYSNSSRVLSILFLHKWKCGRKKHWRHIPFDEVCENCEMTNGHTTSLRALDNIKVEWGAPWFGWVMWSHSNPKKREKNIYLNI